MARRRNATTSTARRVALYARVSTEMQAEEGFSIDAQLSEMRQEAQRRGWQVVAEYVDAGVSGRTLKRPQFKAMMAAAEAHAFDIIMVHDLSRISRSLFDTIDFLARLDRLNIDFISVREPDFDLTTPHGRLVIHILALLNQYYLDQLRMHTTKSKRYRARIGLYNASTPPLGYRHVGDEKTPPEIVPEEAEVVRLAFRLYATGKYSDDQVAHILNERGFRTRTKRRFSKDAVREMLTNPFYVGKVVYRGGRHHGPAEVYEGQHQAIISEDLWEAAQRAREARRGGPAQLQSHAHPHLLAQLLYCHACGRRLRVQNAKSGVYYREVSALRGFDDCPLTRRGARGDRLHPLAEHIIRHLEIPPDWREELRRMLEDDEEVARLRRQRQYLLHERRRLRNAYIAGHFDDDEDEYFQRMAAIQEELARLPDVEEMENLGYIVDMIRTINDLWDDATPQQQQALARLMFRRLVVDVDQARILLVEPEAVLIPLFRRIPFLAERRLGEFALALSAAEAREFGYATLPPLSEVPEAPVAPPFLATWPWPEKPNQRISPLLSEVLKARRRRGEEGGRIVQARAAGVPTLRVDARKWPGYVLETLDLEEALAQPAESVHVLVTPFVLQGQDAPLEMFRRGWRVLAPGGVWLLVDISPLSMPGHWLYSHLPGAWEYVREHALSLQDVYLMAREVGFQTRVREHTWYQDVSPEAALALMQERPPLFRHMPADVWRVGVANVERRVAEAGDVMPGSEVTLLLTQMLRG